LGNAGRFPLKGGNWSSIFGPPGPVRGRECVFALAGRGKSSKIDKKFLTYEKFALIIGYHDN
jgi:hypothetical protein